MHLTTNMMLHMQEIICQHSVVYLYVCIKHLIHYSQYMHIHSCVSLLPAVSWLVSSTGTDVIHVTAKTVWSCAMHFNANGLPTLWPHTSVTSSCTDLYCVVS